MGENARKKVTHRRMGIKTTKAGTNGRRAGEMTFECDFGK